MVFTQATISNRSVAQRSHVDPWERLGLLGRPKGGITASRRASKTATIMAEINWSLDFPIWIVWTLAPSSSIHWGMKSSAAVTTRRVESPFDWGPVKAVRLFLPSVTQKARTWPPTVAAKTSRWAGPGSRAATDLLWVLTSSWHHVSLVFTNVCSTSMFSVGLELLGNDRAGPNSRTQRVR